MESKSELKEKAKELFESDPAAASVVSRKLCESYPEEYNKKATFNALERKAKEFIESNPAEACKLYRALWENFQDEFDKWCAFNAIKALREAKDHDLSWARTLAEKTEDEITRGLYAWLVFDACVKGKNEGDIVKSDQIIGSLPEISPQKNQREENSFPCPTSICVLKLIDAHKKNNFNATRINDLLDSLNADLLSNTERVIDTKDRGLIKTSSDCEKYYNLKSKALLKLEEFESCKSICQEALSKFDKFHHDNDTWLKLRIAICNEKLGNLDESEEQFKELLATRVGSDKWFIYSNLSELFYEQEEYKKAWEYAVQATLHSNEPEYMRGLYRLQIQILNKLGRMNEDGKLLAELIAATIMENQWKIDKYYKKMFKHFEIDVDNLKSSGHYLKEAQKFWTKERYKDALKSYGEIASVHNSGKTGKIKDAYGELIDFHRKNFAKRPRDLKEIVSSKVEFYLMPSFAGKSVPENIIITELIEREKDALVGKEYDGTVRNIVDFGVFVRIEPNTDGLLHKNKIPNILGDFKEHFKAGGLVRVKVTDVSEKGISLGLV